MELDHYHQKVNVRVASQVPKHFEILRKSQWRVPSRLPIRQILTVVPEDWKIICKAFNRITYFIEFHELIYKILFMIFWEST